VVWISKANGGWKHVHGQRGYYRVVIVDIDISPCHGYTREKSTVSIKYETNDVDSRSRKKSMFARMMANDYAYEVGLELNIPVRPAHFNRCIEPRKDYEKTS